jgi:predicted Rossmann fold nucleotide-binding protein DprA/Smf involved in DNA uptake
VGIDQIVTQAGFTVSKTTSMLLSLEFKGIVKLLPGKIYSLLIP